MPNVRPRVARSGRRSNAARLLPRLDRLESRLLLTAGDLDPTFGGRDGAVATATPLGGVLHDTAVLPGGAVLAVGGDSGNSHLVRYAADGGLDKSFGGGDGIAQVL